MNTKLLTLLLAVTLFSFGVYVYNYPPVAHKISATEICADYGNISISKLPLSLLDEMSSNYRQKQLTYINNSLTAAVPSDARAIRFDLETLKIFLNKVESIAKSNGVKSTDSLGIRMYYASYPEEAAMKSTTSLTSLPSNYAGLHTLFAVPTIKINGVDTDFDPTEPATYTQNFRELELYMQSPPPSIPAYLVTRTNRNSGPTNDPSAQNHGGLYPPRNSNGMGF